MYIYIYLQAHGSFPHSAAVTLRKITPAIKGRSKRLDEWTSSHDSILALGR